MKQSSCQKFRNKVKQKTEERKEILELQHAYESGKILEKDLSKNQKQDLRKLYDEQISDLENMIANKKIELNRKQDLVRKYYKVLMS